VSAAQNRLYSAMEGLLSESTDDTRTHVDLDDDVDTQTEDVVNMEDSRQKYNVDPNGHFDGPVLKHMRNMVFGTAAHKQIEKVLKSNKGDSDEIYRKAEEKRNRKRNKHKAINHE